MLISNPMAGSVSSRRREVIVKALKADFKLEAVETQDRDHASTLAKDAVDRGFEAVLAFGGDGTINEVAQGVVGSPAALGVLPGGTANVMAKSLGVPQDPVEATSYLASLLRAGSTRRINVGRLNQRYFLFSCGMGLDAEVVRRVEADPEGKRKRREWSYVTKLLSAGVRDYRSRDPQITFTPSGGEPERTLLTICCNGRPFTYFRSFPVDVCPLATLDGGLDFLSLDRLPVRRYGAVAWGVLKSRKHIEHKSATYHHDIEGGTLEADLPLPVQVDGDYIGELERAEVALLRDALDLLA